LTASSERLPCRRPRPLSASRSLPGGRKMREKLTPGDLLSQRAIPIGKLILGASIAKMFGIRPIVDEFFPSKMRDGASLGLYAELMFVNAFIGPVPQEHIGETIGTSPVLAKILGEFPVQKLTGPHFSAAFSRIGKDKEKFANAVKAIYRQAYYLTFNEEASVFYYDTSNIKTYISENNPSELAKHGHSKEKRYDLKIIAISHLVESLCGIGVHCGVHPGSRHDSKIILDEYDDILDALLTTGGDIFTLSFDKGVKSIEIMKNLDEHGIDFVAPLKIDEARNLLDLSTSLMDVLETEKNKQLESEGKLEERTLGRSEIISYAGRLRTVVVIFSPPVKARHDATLDRYVSEARTYLMECRAKINNGEKKWTNPDEVQKRIDNYMRSKSWPTGIYNYTLDKSNNGLKMSFSKDINKINAIKKYHGITVLVASSTCVTPSKVSEIYDGKWVVEFAFKDFKSMKHTRATPVFVWTDPTIKVSTIIKMLAVTGHRFMEKILADSGLDITYNIAFQQMEDLHCVKQVRVNKHGRQFTEQTYDTPDDTEAKILAAVNLRIENANLLFLDEKASTKYGVRNPVGRPKKVNEFHVDIAVLQLSRHVTFKYTLLLLNDFLTLQLQPEQHDMGAENFGLLLTLEYIIMLLRGFLGLATMPKIPCEQNNCTLPSNVIEIIETIPRPLWIMPHTTLAAIILIIQKNILHKSLSVFRDGEVETSDSHMNDAEGRVNTEIVPCRVIWEETLEHVCALISMFLDKYTSILHCCTQHAKKVENKSSAITFENSHTVPAIRRSLFDNLGEACEVLQSFLNQPHEPSPSEPNPSQDSPNRQDVNSNGSLPHSTDEDSEYKMCTNPQRANENESNSTQEDKLNCQVDITDAISKESSSYSGVDLSSAEPQDPQVNVVRLKNKSNSNKKTLKKGEVRRSHEGMAVSPKNPGSICASPTENLLKRTEKRLNNHVRGSGNIAQQHLFLPP